MLRQQVSAVAMAAIATCFIHSTARAQGTCGAAGGAPPGPAYSVCDFAKEAAGLPADGPALGVGNPIDLATGNKYRHELDLRTDGHVPLVFARHYNSRNRHVGPLGVGWSHSFETRLVRVRIGQRTEIQIIQGDGRRIVFTPHASHAHQWRTALPTQGLIVHQPQSRSAPAHWVWKWPAGRAVRFDAHGRIQAILRDEQPVLHAHHDRAGHLIALSGPHGSTLHFEYQPTAHGQRLRQVSNEQGLVIARYEHDPTGQLSSVQWPDGRMHRYEYNALHDPLLLTRVVAVGAAAPTGGPQHTVQELARYAYDSQGRAVSYVHSEAGETVSVEYLARPSGSRPGQTSVTTAHGQRALYTWTYDRHRHVSRMLRAQGHACSVCPPTARTYHWSTAGLLQRIDSSPDGQPTSISLEHDHIGRPTAAWQQTTRASNAKTLLWRVHYPNNDPLAWPSRIDQPSVAPGRLHRIDIEFDRLGRPIAVAERGYRPSPGAARFEALTRRFTLGHRAITDTDHPAQWLTALAWVDGPSPGTHDRIGIEQIGEHLRLTHPGRVIESLTYQGGVLHQHMPVQGGLTRMQRNVPQEHWLGGPTLIGAFSGDAQIDLEYDASGVLRGLSKEHFAQRTLTRVEHAPAAPERTAPLASHRVLAFWRGRPTAIQLADGSVFRRGFDDFGRVAFIAEPGQAIQWAHYDEADRLIRHVTADGAVLHYERDALGRLTSSTRTDGGATTVLGRFRWSGRHLAHAANDTVSIQYTWDTLGRLTAAEHRFTAQPDQPLRYHWHYDLASRVAEETLPDGVTVQYRYHGRNVAAVQISGPGLPPATLTPSALTRPLALEAFTAQPPDPGRIVHEGNRLIEAAGVQHLVDPHGRRAAKRSALPITGTSLAPTPLGQEHAFAHQDWRLRSERLPEGSLKHWIWADARPIALVAGGKVYALGTDSRAAPVQAYDATGQLIWAATYNPSGAARIELKGQIEIPLRLPGQYADAETGWHYNHWRTYSPFIGRYLEPDPLGLQPDYVGRLSLTDYAGGDPIGSIDPWGLARLTWYALTTDAQGKPMGRTQGFDRARWSFMIEDILPVPLTGSGAYPPATAGLQGVLFDPWGDFVRGTDAPATGNGNALDSIAWSGATGRQVFASFAAHYGGALVSPQRFVVDGFDDRRAGALALIVSASPSQRQACIARALSSLPALALGPAEPLLAPASIDSKGPARVLECQAPTTLTVPYRDDLERSRVERYQAAAELQESPSASINENCGLSVGCRTRARIEVNGRSYWASYGRTQFTVTTFLGELSRLTQPSGGADAASLRSALKLDTAVSLDGRPAILGDALELARRRVESAYRTFATLRTEFGRGLSATQALQVWEGLSPQRRDAFSNATGLGRDGFIDMLGFVATGIGGRTEEEGRHALAASAAATVRYTSSRTSITASGTSTGAAETFEQWLIALYSSEDPYDHVSRVFLRDNLRRVMQAPTMAGRFVNTEAPDSLAWYTRQSAIELELAQRVAVLHNSGRFDLATRPQLDVWLRANRTNWIAGYVEQFTTIDTRGNFEALRCASGLGGRAGLQFTTLSAMADPLIKAPGAVRKSLLR